MLPCFSAIFNRVAFFLVIFTIEFEYFKLKLKTAERLLISLNVNIEKNDKGGVKDGRASQHCDVFT